MPALRSGDQTTSDVNTLEFERRGENARLQSILRMHVLSRGGERKKLRQVLVEYLRYSPNSHDLIDEVINCCIDLTTPNRLDIAVDVLSQLQRLIHEYAFQFLINDIRNWSHLYPSRAYQPNDDYWYILLRSVAQADVEDKLKLQFISMCSGATSRGVLEGVVEALSDVGTSEAKIRLEAFREHEDSFLSELATEVLDQE